ncbi:MAG: aminotransferase [Thermoprotei archaeon]|nr:MAG: aminotransferase [Thermoprotei archaeon]RLF00478.1 MAG: aminotransferase [Thermoprotei archaeon]HDI75276.1 alanine--glyoxylate aminotransferase family protein [Thermoprotei archaeon]
MIDPLLLIPGPTNIHSEVVRAMARPAISHRAEEFRKLFEDTIEKARKVFKTTHDIFLLTASGTGGVECAIVNTLSLGDKVIVPVYGEFSERGLEIARRIGANCVVEKMPLGEGISFEKAKEIIDANSDATAIFLVYNDTSPGVEIRELEKICRYAKSRNILTIVDAISIAGGDYLNIDEWGIDLCVIGTQKCLASPPGVTLITVSPDAWTTISKKKCPSFYFDLERYKKYSEKRETPFTPAIHLVYALNEGLSLILSEGVENWIKRHYRNRRALAVALEKIGFTEFVKEPFRSTTVISLNCPQGISPSVLVSRLYGKTRVLIARGLGELKEKIIRIGNMGITSLREILTLIASLSYVMLDYGVTVNVGEAIKAAREAYES